MNSFKFDNFAKAFCICAVLYIYIFILSDVLHLRPEDDGDMAFFGKIFGLFPTLAVLFCILFDRGDSRLRKMQKVLVGLPFVLMGGIFLFFFFINFSDGFQEQVMLLKTFVVFGFMIGLIPFIPLIIYFIYKKTRDKASFVLLAVGLCILGLSLYPAKDYIQAKFSGDPCATKRLIVRQYAGSQSEYQEVEGDVMCIATDRGYPSETYKWQIFDLADAKTFEYLGDGYSLDKNTVFYEGIPIEADPKTFSMDAEWKSDEMANFIRGGIQYKRDDQNIFFEGQEVLVKNVSQFRIIDFCDSYLCATDGSSVFKEGKVVKDVNLSTLTSFHSCQYAKDENQVYYGGAVIEGADVNTFSVYGEDRYCYAYDIQHVYYKGELVPDSIPSVLQKIRPDDPFSPETDGKHIYFNGKQLDIDVNNFQYLGKSVIKDDISVYQGEKKIEGADAATFELIPVSMPQALNVCAKDKNHSYFDGEIRMHPICTGEGL